MITDINIKNYKSVVDVSLPLGRFNLLMPVPTNWITSTLRTAASGLSAPG